MSTTVQLNVRMERAVRDAGNAAIQSKGISPTLLVRTLWERISQRGQALEDVVELLFGDEDPREMVDAAVPMAQGEALYRALLHEVGLESVERSSAFAGRAYDQMKEEALLDRWGERGLADG